MEILKLRENDVLIPKAAQWFHDKWGVSIMNYEESMQQSLNGHQSIPQWYVAVEDDQIIAGVGVIENDFHNRKDLSPNVCGLYVDEKRRNESIAANLLQYVCDDMSAFDINTLYLVTDYDAFYEKYGWQFLGMVQSEDDVQMLRMYEHTQ